MSKYVFRCKCGKEKEKEMKIAEFAYIICEKCGETMQRVYTPVPHVGEKVKGKV